MSNIGNYKNNYINTNTQANTPVNSNTEKIRKFVEYLHNFIPAIEKEFDDLEKRSQTKSCKAFEDKMGGLSAIYQAEKNLYYWYIEHRK